MPHKNKNTNTNTNTNPSRGGGGGGRPFRGGRGGRGRGGRGRGGGGGGGGGGQAQLASELDMMSDFIVAPPSPEHGYGSSSSPFRGRGRGRGGRGRGRGGFVQPQTYDNGFQQGDDGGFRGRGRGRGGWGGRGRGGAVPGSGTAMLQDDLQVMNRMFASEDQANNQQGDYTSVLFPARGGRGAARGGRGGKAPRGRGAPPSNFDPPGHRRTSGIGAGPSPQASRTYPNSNYRPVDLFGPLSSLLHRERPLLRPIVFVPSVHTRILFSCDDEDEANEVQEEVKEEVVHVENVDELDGGLEVGDDAQHRGEFAAHAPTADRVMRVFMGSPIPSDESSSSSEGEDDLGGEVGGIHDMEDIEEIDFDDLSKLMNVDAKKAKTKKKTKTKASTTATTNKLWMEQGVGEEMFLGMRTTSTTTMMAITASKLDSTSPDAGGGQEQEKIVLAVDEMHIDGHTKDLHVEASPADAAPDTVVEAEDARDLEPAVPSQQQKEGEGTVLDFVIDTDPTPSFIIDTSPIHAHTHTHEKPRIRTPPPLNLQDEDDEVIVYVAPHPRRSEVNGAMKSQAPPPKPIPNDAYDQPTFTPYEGILGRGAPSTHTGVEPTAPSIHTAANPSSTSTSNTTPAFPALGTPRASKRLAAPALSTPRMAKQVAAKQKKVQAKREKDAERRRKARVSLQGQFDKKRKGRGGFGFGAIGAMMQERELRDEYGSGSEDEGVDRRWKERREGDSDLDWGTEDEGDGTQRRAGVKGGGKNDEEYMTLPELQQVWIDSGSTLQDQEGEGGFIPFTPTAAAKRRDRRRRSGANANAGAAANKRKDDSIAAAMEMDVDSDLDVEAMKQFAGGMLGKDAGVHVTFGDLEDEMRMRDEDADGRGGIGDSGDSESEDEEEDDEDEKEMQKVVDFTEELMMAEDLAEMSIEDEDDDDDDDDEEKTPKSNFTARLQKIRDASAKQKAKAKGKGKAKEDEDEDEFDDDMDFDDDDEDEDEDGDDYFKKNIKWTMKDGEGDLVDLIQDFLDDNEDVLSNRDRKQSKKLFKAISNGEFDYLDEDFYFPQAKRGKKAQRDAIPPTLRAQWDKDREVKAERKQQRELEKLLQAGDPFASKKGGKKGRKAMLAAARLDPTNTVVPNRIIDMTTLVQMLHKFVDDLGGKQTLSLPPTSKETRKNVHQLALAFGLKSISKGKGDARYVTVAKTTRTGPGRVDERRVARIVKQSGGPGARGNDFMSGAKGAGGKVQVPKHKEGEVVGKAAPKIGSSNVGFKMLTMMGWSEGERIGVGGLEAPIEAIIKHSKLGLGAMR